MTVWVAVLAVPVTHTYISREDRKKHRDFTLERRKRVEIYILIRATKKNLTPSHSAFKLEIKNTTPTVRCQGPTNCRERMHEQDAEWVGMQMRDGAMVCNVYTVLWLDPSY